MQRTTKKDQWTLRNPKWCTAQPLSARLAVPSHTGALGAQGQQRRSHSGIAGTPWSPFWVSPLRAASAARVESLHFGEWVSAHCGFLAIKFKIQQCSDESVWYPRSAVHVGAALSLSNKCSLASVDWCCDPQSSPPAPHQCSQRRPCFCVLLHMEASVLGPPYIGASFCARWDILNRLPKPEGGFTALFWVGFTWSLLLFVAFP